uniref:MLO-like protein n=1 Tax=Chenopodium quinoa TaxID=63459 RepID=A0A803KTZ4_CHEQI
MGGGNRMHGFRPHFFGRREVNSLHRQELMLVGFISLLLTVFQGRIGRLCISHNLANKWLPCKKEPQAVPHTHAAWRHLLSESTDSTYCQQQGKVPLLSVTALHHLHIFIFVLAVVHVIMCALTVLFGGFKIKSQWQTWEELIHKKELDPEHGRKDEITVVEQHDFIKGRSWAVHYTLLGWVTHCKGNPKFNFHKYMVRAYEADFKRVVGIRAFVQFVCSYSTLPLYAIVTQMGSSFNKAIFEDYIQEGLIHWAQKARKTTTSLHAPDTTKKVTPKRTMSMPAVRLSTMTDKQHDQDSTIKEIQLENDHVK